MTDVVIAALAGFGLSVALNRSSARIEQWWDPTWKATRRVFAFLRSTNVAAFTGSWFAAILGTGIIKAIAAGTVSIALAEGALLLLVRSRT